MAGLSASSSSSSGRLELVDPCTGEAYASVATTDASSAARAVERAAQAGPAWAAAPPEERIDAVSAALVALEREAGAFADLVSQELGTPRHLTAKLHIAPSLTTFRTTVDEARDYPFAARLDTSLVLREPVGVAVAITPWNYPLIQIANKVAPALVAGCPVVLKPSELTPLDALLLRDVLVDAGVPRDLLQVVVGTGAALGPVLTTHPDVRAVSFTGSTRVGTQVAAAATTHGKRVGLELGGKSASVLLPGGDVEAAVRHCVTSVTANAGQTCTALSRLIAPSEDLRAVHAAVEAAMAGVRVGDRDDPDADIGPVVSARQRDSVLAHVEGARGRGLPELTDPARPVPRRGFFVAPTVFTEVPAGDPLSREEVFGPVLAIQAYDTVEEAVRLANDTDYGLSGAVWGPDDAAAVGVAARLDTGMVTVNGGQYNPRAPFGGRKLSGFGREKGRWGIDEFVDLKAVQLPVGSPALATPSLSSRRGADA